MRLSERVTHALIGAALGAGIGLAGWLAGDCMGWRIRCNTQAPRGTR